MQKDWNLQLADTLSEEEIINRLADKLVQYLEKGPDAFYQLMYRLDISEKKLKATFGDKDVAQKIARLIYERQLQKAESRQRHKTKIQDDDPELKW